MTPSLTTLAKDIETALKGALKRGFTQLGSFELRFDHDALTHLNEALEAIGFNVYGMSYTESEICITLQLNSDLTEACGNNLFHYCQFSFNNDGNFDVELDDDALEDLHLTLTTSYDQSIFSKATTSEIDKVVQGLQIAFQTRLLKVL